MNTSTVSVIIPARNEEARIAACLESIVAQETAPAEVIVVDDASSDATAARVEALQRIHPSLRLIRNGSLPAGWTGKNYALHLGAAGAGGEWLLFLDADVTLAPHALSRALREAEAQGLDLLSLSPEQVCETWWERAIQPAVFAFLASRYRLRTINDPDSPLAAANGQFLLIRRSVYDALGGHVAVRSEVVEDVMLALRAKDNGYRIALQQGAGLARVRMYASLRELFEGWGKNLYFLAGNTPAALLTSGFWVLKSYLLPPTVLLAGLGLSVYLPPTGYLVLAIGGVWIFWQFSLIARRYTKITKSRHAVFLAPVGGLALLGLLAYSGWRRWVRKSVTWKGRTYQTIKS